METKNNCKFCDYGRGTDQPEGGLLGGNEHAIVFWSKAPRTATHALVIPRRHVVAWHDITEAEDAWGIWRLVSDFAACGELEHYRIRANSGYGAGQRVFHLHLHVQSSAPPGVSLSEIRSRLGQ